VSLLSSLKVEPIRVEVGTQAVGRSAVELDLRRTSGALVVGVARAGGLVQGWTPTESFHAGDVVFLAGEGTALREATKLFTTPVQAASGS
jgi:K+/H+ antiporter YhaU regulatory subunit KhtT